jgi:Na+-transporting NADH:ubiquinone oxidoreductase subunit A
VEISKNWFRMQVFRLRIPLTFSLIITFLSTISLSAQSTQGNGNLYAVALLVIVGALILVSAVLLLSESFLAIEGKKAGVKTPTSNLWSAGPPKYAAGASVVNLSKGHDILLKGAADKTISNIGTRFSMRPGDFRGLPPIPKVIVEVGDEVKAGDVLFHAKKDTTVKYVSPVSGEVVEIRRGEKRAISDIIILADKEIKHKQFDPPSIAEGSRAEIVDFLCETGAWTLFNERPYDLLPSVDSLPKNIFISTFDSAPLAPDLNYVVKGKEEAFQKGLDTLDRLTEGAVCLGLDARGETAPHEAFTNAQRVEKTYFGGAHPSGNVGVQMHHTHPINTGDKVWTLTVQEVITLGQLMYKGIWDASRVVAITGGQVSKPQYANTYVGAQIGELLHNNLSDIKLRMIDGDVLSGKHVHNDEFLSYRSDQLTVIEEGDYFEMFGWLLPLKPRPTISKTFPNALFKTLKFDGDTNTHGEQRAFVVTGQYEQVLPMDIYPQHLMKAIMVGDIEQMEGYGINELSEEDVALCEFTCTSKQPLQSILRDGLDMLREQG